MAGYRPFPERPPDQPHQSGQLAGAGADSWLPATGWGCARGRVCASVDGGADLLEQFGRYLTGERALTVPVARAYCHWVRPFTEEVFCANEIGFLAGLTAGDVTRFLTARLPHMSRSPRR